MIRYPDRAERVRDGMVTSADKMAASATARMDLERGRKRMASSEVARGLYQEDAPVIVEIGGGRSHRERALHAGCPRHVVSFQLDDPVRRQIEAQREGHVVLMRGGATLSVVHVRKEQRVV